MAGKAGRALRYLEAQRSFGNPGANWNPASVVDGEYMLGGGEEFRTPRVRETFKVRDSDLSPSDVDELNSLFFDD